MTAGAPGRDRPVPLQPAVPPPAAASGDGSGAAEGRGPLRATTVLADRMAAALVHREPGWRLPRRTALARRYNVSLTEIDAALGDLARRSLVRRLPDGQLYRASPADYWIPVEGAAGLGTRLDPMGGAITCQARHVSRREAPQDVAWALRLPSGAPIRVVRCVWACAGDPAAVSTAYLNESPGDEDAEPGQEEDQPGSLARLGAERSARRRGQRRDVPAAAGHRPQPAPVARAAGDHRHGQVRRRRHRGTRRAHRGRPAARAVPGGGRHDRGARGHALSGLLSLLPHRPVEAIAGVLFLVGAVLLWRPSAAGAC